MPITLGKNLFPCFPVTGNKSGLTLRGRLQEVETGAGVICGTGALFLTFTETITGVNSCFFGRSPGKVRLFSFGLDRAAEKYLFSYRESRL